MAQCFYGSVSRGGSTGCGAIFQATPGTSGSGYDVTAIHTFGGAPDGCGPMAALTLGPGGVLYGTTPHGGIAASPCPSDGCGVAFQLTPPATSGAAWTENVIYRFTAANGDGAFPYADLVVDRNGVLYGATKDGGAVAGSNPSCESSGVAGCGTVFKLSPPAAGGVWTETVLHNFTGENGDGAYPTSFLTPKPSGGFYGTTKQGGATNNGTVFEIRP